MPKHSFYLSLAISRYMPSHLASVVSQGEYTYKNLVVVAVTKYLRLDTL